MKQLVIEKEARLTYLKRELTKSITHSRYFNQRNCHYEAPTRAIPKRVKRLIKEIVTLEKEMGLRATEEPQARVGSPMPRQVGK